MPVPSLFALEYRLGRVTLTDKLAPPDVHERFKDKPTDFGLKVVMMGDGAVGKTSLVLSSYITVLIRYG